MPGIFIYIFTICAGAKEVKKRMKVKVIRKFRDKTDNLKLRNEGDELEVSEDRAKLLKSMNLVEDVQEVKIKKNKAAE